MDRNRGIGVENRLSWRLPADMKRFRSLTMGHHLIVGRKTFDSIGSALPGRQMIVVTRDQTYRKEGCFVVHSVEEAIELARSRGEVEVFIGGGAEIYRQAIATAQRIYLTEVDAEVKADTFFPEIVRDEWREECSEVFQSDEQNPYTFTLKLLVRKQSAKC